MLQVEIRNPTGAVYRRYRAKGLTERGPRGMCFSNDRAGTEMTVLQYYNGKGIE